MRRFALLPILLLLASACKEKECGKQSASAAGLSAPEKARFGTSGGCKSGSCPTRRSGAPAYQGAASQGSGTLGAFRNGKASFDGRSTLGGSRNWLAAAKTVSRDGTPDVRGVPLGKSVDTSEAYTFPQRYATDRGKKRTIAVRRLRPGNSSPITFTADMDIVADGAGGAWKRDRTGQSKTALRYKDGGSLDPSKLPFIVIPIGFETAHPGARLGDYAAVTFKGNTAYAIVGDKGPRGVLGEGSIALAKALGIDPDPNKGGTSEPVSYVIFPGSRDAEAPRDAAAVARKGASLLRRL